MAQEEKPHLTTTRLTQIGDDLALVIEQDMLDLLNIDTETPWDISTVGGSIILTPVRDAEGEKKLSEALEKVNRKHGKALKRLAD